MQVWEIALLGVALAMDACAVAMTNGMTESKMSAYKAVLIGVFFGFFQFLMPLLGYYITGVIADAFLSTFEAISAWISFVLLVFLGGKMIYESVRELRAKKQTTCEVREKPPVLTLGKLCVQAIATSIDALAVGVTLQMAALSETGLATGAWGATGMIGAITLVLSIAAVYIGKAIGDKLADKAGLFGGAVLVGIGLKILIEGLL